MALSNIAQFRPSRRPSANHRTFPRLEVLDQFHGRLVAIDLPLKIRDLSIGGFSVESPISFPPGAVHQFRFTLQTGVVHQVNATAIHCRTTQPLDGIVWYVSGFEFIHDADDDGATARTVDALLDAATSVLTFD